MKLPPRHLLGHIDCPACGTAAGMRVTADKNGEPFGYCEATCNVQMRLGGNPQRVAAFLARHPHLTPADTVTAPAAAPAAAKDKPLPVQVQVQGQPARSANPFDFLLKGAGA